MVYRVVFKCRIDSDNNICSLGFHFGTLYKGVRPYRVGVRYSQKSQQNIRNFYLEFKLF